MISPHYTLGFMLLESRRLNNLLKFYDLREVENTLIATVT